MSKRTRLSRMTIWVWRVAVVCRKELVQFFRNWILAIFVVYAFTYGVYGTATSVSQELKNAKLSVVDNDRSSASRELIYRFQKPQFRLSQQVSDGRVGIKQLDNGDASLVLDIPQDFEKDLYEGRHARIQVQLDGSDASRAYLTANYVGNIVNRFSDEVAWQRVAVDSSKIATLPVVENEERIWFSLNHDETLFTAIQELSQQIFLFSLLLPAAALAREKERGTVEQLLVSPLDPLQIMLGKILPMIGIVLLASVVSLLVVIEGVLDLQVRGRIGLFLLVTGIFSFSAAGLGIFISSVTHSIGQVGLVSITLMPIMLMLSGSDTPPEMMPEALLPIMLASPLYHYLNSVFGILIKGAPLSMIRESVLWMSLLGSGVFGFSLIRFRRNFR